VATEALSRPAACNRIATAQCHDRPVIPEDQARAPIDASSPLIAGAREAFETALRRGDARAAGEAYSIDAILLAPGAEVLNGRPAIEAFWRTGLETGVLDVQLEVIAVQQQGDAAVEVGRYALHVSPDDGAAIVDRGRYLIVHRFEQDGRWRRAAEMFGPDEADPGMPR